jgi:probable phosphoglycerate mutase
VLTEPTDFCRLFLLRHPELDPEFQNFAVGGGDANLSRRGRAQVLQWREWLELTPVAAVHSSPQNQCRAAAEAVVQGKEVEVAIDERLRDQSMGRWQGRAWNEILQQEGEALRTFFAEFGDAQPPGGESLGAAVERMLEWWTAQAADAAGQALVVVLPGSLLAGYAAAMLGMRLSRCVSLQLPHGGLGVLDVFQNGARIACWNPGGLLAD